MVAWLGGAGGVGDPGQGPSEQCWCHLASSAEGPAQGRARGWQALPAAAPLCSPTGVRWQQGEERPRNSSSRCSPSRPGLGCAWKRQMRRSVQDGCSRPEGWVPLACPHPGHPSVPSRLDPLQRRDLRGAPGLLGPRRWQAGGGPYPAGGGRTPGRSPAGSTSGRGGIPCPAGRGGGTRPPGHHQPWGDRAQAALAHQEKEG